MDFDLSSPPASVCRDKPMVTPAPSLPSTRILVKASTWEVRANRHLPLERITEIVIAAVADWIGDNEQPDDVTLVLARAK
jgi:hypothetical protein